MTQNTGILVLKRMSCQDSECVVFKVGACIDVNEQVWSHYYNEQISDMIGEAKIFGQKAEALMIAAGSASQLADQYTCSSSDQQIADDTIKLY